MELVRILLAVAAHYGWKVHHMDVKFTFLNGDLAEEVYVVQPLGFAASGKEGMVFRLHRTFVWAAASVMRLELKPQRIFVQPGFHSV
jgi:hypothetical protein